MTEEAGHDEDPRYEAKAPAANPEAGPDDRTQPPSGDVPPGETPPASDQVGAPQGHEEHGPGRATPWLWIALIVLIVGLMAMMFLAQGISLMS